MFRKKQSPYPCRIGPNGPIVPLAYGLASRSRARQSSRRPSVWGDHPSTAASLLLFEPQGVQIRIFHHEAQPDRLTGNPGQGLI